MAKSRRPGAHRGKQASSSEPQSGRTRLRDFIRRLLESPHDEHATVLNAPAMTLRQVWTRFWPDARPLRWWVLASTVLAAIVSGITVVEISLFKYVVDDVLVARDFRPLLWIAMAYLGLALGSGLLSGLNTYLSTWLTHSFLVKLRSRIFGHVLALPQEVHDHRRLGDSMARITGDSASVESFMIGTVRSAATTFLTALFYLIALILLDARLTLASLVIVPVFWFISQRFSRLIKINAREQRRRGGSLSAITEEHLGNAALVQTFNREPEAVATFTRETLGIRSAALAGARVRALFSPLVDISELIGLLTVILLGTQALASGRLTLGGLMAFLTMMLQLYAPMRSMATLLPGALADAAGCERVAELLDEQPPPQQPGARPLLRPGGGVELDRVSVTYPGANRAALADVSLCFEPGTIVAVIGPSGAGKSTLVKLLLRAIDPKTGAVRVGDEDLRDVTLRSVRDAVALVPQEISLLDASVRDNIGFARHGATASQIENAARAADADQFIRSLPHSYDTMVGQKARTLSGGQRQRLSLARAFLKDSPLLLLDEPTTGLDPETARRVMEPLRWMSQDRTTIIVTHDPTALEIADRVVTLSQGRIVGDEAVISTALSRKASE